MYCPNCAAQNETDMKFCRACGQDLALISQAMTKSARMMVVNQVSKQPKTLTYDDSSVIVICFFKRENTMSSTGSPTNDEKVIAKLSFLSNAVSSLLGPDFEDELYNFILSYFQKHQGQMGKWEIA